MEMIRAREIPNGVVNVSNLSANNLLQKFFITSNHICHRDNGENREEVKKMVEVEEEREEEEKEVELSLGLSLNGQFSTDPRSRKNKNFELRRSSSIPEGFVFNEQRSGGGDTRRTRSLPVETERKRKRSEETRAFMDFPVITRGQVAETEKAKERFVGNERGKNVNSAKNKKNVQVSGMEKARNILEDMLCVSTRDVGADGKRVEGFLYWYGGNKEEVKIVCVCHGSFLSPAEFVRHGGVTDRNGGADVAINPLRHIVVKLPSSL